MSSSNDSDRRRILAAAVAAAAAAPLAAQAQPMREEPRPGKPMHPHREGPPTRIQVDLGGAHLPRPIAERLGGEIQRACFAALHEAGYNAGENWLRPHPEWYGIWIDPEWVRRAEAEAQGER